MLRSPLKKYCTSDSSTIERELELLDAQLAVERMESEANYLSRGRPLRSLKDSALKRRWYKCLRREFAITRARRTERDDISAEFSIRGIVNVELPPDIIELVVGHHRRSIFRELDGKKVN
jgi:hypothetical protein